MANNEQNTVLSLELHLFFARIMKEHSLFLMAGFTPVDTSFQREAQFFKQEFEKLLYQTVKMSQWIISPKVLNSGEIITEFTACAEWKTEHFTGIPIDEAITAEESQLTYGGTPKISADMSRQVKDLNQNAVRSDSCLRLLCTGLCKAS